MDVMGSLLVEHGVIAVFLVVFLKRAGVPLPALPFLMLAGARAASDARFAVAAMLSAIAASVVADGAWFLAGRLYGRRMLALMCRVSISPDSCIRKSELVFSRRGALTVLLSKFIPGVGGLAPPLAGALRMPTGSFTLLNLAGASLWTASSMGLGLLFHRSVQQLVHWLGRMGGAAIPYLAAASALYLGFLATRRVVVNMRLRKAPRVQPHELAEMLAGGVKVVLIDVRGPRDAILPRIHGARTWAEEEIAGIEASAAGFEHVIYCDCPNEVSAAKVALRMLKRGVRVRVLAGGFNAWIAAGLPLESPSGDRTPHLI